MGLQFGTRLDTQQVVEVKPSEKDMRRLKRFAEQFPRQLPRVVSGAINLTARAAKTQAIREIAKKGGLKLKDVRKRTKMTPATFKRWAASIYFIKKRLGLSSFKARQTQKGVSYDLGQGQKTIKGAFLAEMDSGHMGVFIRKNRGDVNTGQWDNGKKKNVKWSNIPKKYKLPIRELFGLSVWYIYDEVEQLSRRVMVEAQAKLHKNIQSKIDWILSRRAS